MPDDQAWQLIDDLVEMDLTSWDRAASASDIMHSLSIADLGEFTRVLGELLDEDFIRRRGPRSLRETVKFYVNTDRIDRALKALDPDYERPEPIPTDWGAVRDGIATLSNALNTDTSLQQADRAQAGAVIASLQILVEAPDPPSKTIRNLLYDLAAIATIFALAAEIASMIR